MTSAAIALASPVPSSDGPTIGLLRRLRDDLGLAFQTLRKLPAFRLLGRCAWSVFQAIATHWRGKDSAFPSQEAIGAYMGYSSDTSIRTATRALVAAGMIALKRTRRRDGSEQIHYGPGPSTIEGLWEFVRRYPKGEPDGAPRRVVARPRLVPTPPATIAVTPPATIGGEPVKIQIQNSSCEGTAENGFATRPEEEEAIKRGDSPAEALARDALAAHLQRVEPAMRIPKLFNAAHVAMVVACIHTLGGDTFDQAQALHDALAGAWSRSNGAPTPSYVWGRIDLFHEHVKRGRAQRLAIERAKARPSPSPRTLPADLEPTVSADEIASTLAALFAKGGALA